MKTNKIINLNNSLFVKLKLKVNPKIGYVNHNKAFAQKIDYHLLTDSLDIKLNDVWLNNYLYNKTFSKFNIATKADVEIIKNLKNKNVVKIIASTNDDLNKHLITNYNYLGKISESLINQLDFIFKEKSKNIKLLEPSEFEIDVIVEVKKVENLTNEYNFVVHLSTNELNIIVIENPNILMLQCFNSEFSKYDFNSPLIQNWINNFSEIFDSLKTKS